MCILIINPCFSMYTKSLFGSAAGRGTTRLNHRPACIGRLRKNKTKINKKKKKIMVMMNGVRIIGYLKFRHRRRDRGYTTCDNILPLSESIN